ncbi:MAG: type II toxin-antitoxin system RelE/ParE family toxin [Planctomycetota bacterium]|nr:type II toxin-antitoxin system RelE/ParE family toxin [Planctomycetota bacterium]MDA1162312.1 type II toxin-antitoxin system RelE/ParE family toxin [Planctomycetota bacterium]
MPDRLRFHSLFVSDLEKAVEWYDSVSVELGNRFRSMVDSRFDDIAESSESFGLVFEDVRFARLRKFPYIILFRPVSNTVHVLGLFHGASNPEKWHRRT